MRKSRLPGLPLLRRPPRWWTGCVYARYIDNATHEDDADHLLAPVTTVDSTD